MEKKVALLILDGWGIGSEEPGNAVFRAHTPFFDRLLESNPHTVVCASGEDVGLPAGQMGNSEVGHLNLGAGRVVYQELGRINRAIVNGELLASPLLENAFAYAKTAGKNVHFMGLISDGGVHSHIRHLEGLCEAAAGYGMASDQVFIHGFLDGRDTDPLGGLNVVRDLESFLSTRVGTLASLIGRYYAMDRDRRWERIKKAYDLLVRGVGSPSTDLIAAVLTSYEQGVTDEFFEPVVRVDSSGRPIGVIQPGDVVVCFNFRTDRGREITMALTQQDFPHYQMYALDLRYITMTPYDDTFQGVDVIFDKSHIQNTLGEVLSNAGKTQIRIAETEKYPHVTFFFSGGREEPFPGEKRLMVASPKVPTYDLMPEMSAQGIVDALRAHLNTALPDFICLNFANPDMVGHTGVLDAVIRAVETVDQCAEQVVRACLDRGYSLLILADHGNAEYMRNADGSPHTAHTTNPVPLILIDPAYRALRPGKLGDIAPTILELMRIPVPSDMTGESLLVKSI